MIKAEIIADSVAYHGKRLTSFVLTYPRFIHSEFMTHRVFSRNAASSRAIPVAKMIERIEKEMAMPISWGKNKKGMQATEALPPEDAKKAETIWMQSAKEAIKHTEELVKLGVHKQIANRILEPYSHITTIATATELGNFFNLRVHPDAQPEFQELALQMLLAYNASTPQEIGEGWHIPFGDKHMKEEYTLAEKLVVATARCARVSYLTFDGEISLEKDLELHNSLMASGHFSPFEHCALAGSFDFNVSKNGNFDGFKQYRKMLPKENKKNYNAQALIEGINNAKKNSI